MIKILANDGIEADGKMLLEEADYLVETQKVPQDELAKVLPEYDAIIVRSATQVRKELIDVCPKLKMIARGGVGLDNIDVEYARSKGITVISTPAASSQSVAELAVAHMFTLARSLQISNREMPVRGGTDFKKLKSALSEGVQLRGKTLAIIGLGRIGQEVARIGLALGMHVMPVDLIVNETVIGINFYNMEDVRLSIRLHSYKMEEALKKADFITLHVPSTGQPVIGKKEFDLMKKGAFLINAARGGVVDELALLEALNSGKLAGAGMDTFDNEPTPRQELLDHPKISLTPHIGAATLEAQSQIGLELADKIIAFFGEGN